MKSTYSMSTVPMSQMSRSYFYALIRKMTMHLFYVNTIVYYSFTMFLFHYRPQTKLREGNVFTGIYDSVHRGSLVPGVSGLGGTCSGGGYLLRGSLVPGGDARWRWYAAGGTHPTGLHSCFLHARACVQLSYVLHQ